MIGAEALASSAIKKTVGKNSLALPIAAAAISVVGGGLKAFGNVPSGHVGVRTRFDRAERKEKSRRAGEIYGIVGPGMRWTIPFSDSIHLVSVQPRNHQLGAVLTQFAADGQVKIESSITWHVRSDHDYPYRAFVNAMDEETLTRTVADIGTTGLRKVVSGVRSIRVLEAMDVESRLKEEVEQDLLEYGAQLDRHRIDNAFVSDAQMEINAQKQGHWLLGITMAAQDALRSARG